MKNLTTPQAILIGLFLIALAIASIPFSHVMYNSTTSTVGQELFFQTVSLSGKSIDAKCILTCLSECKS